MNKSILVLLSLIISITSFKEKPKSRVIVAVLAHPDDEVLIGPLFVKYGKTNKVHLIIATDGRYGIKPGFPTGDSLAKLRQTESECGCKILGIQPPIFLGFSDGFDTRNGVGIYLDQSKQLKEKLTRKINELNPDVIITFGPEGDAGHSDHRMISNMTTEIILKEGWVEKFPLYYIGWLKKDDEKMKDIIRINTVDSKYLNVSIKFTHEDENKAMQAFECYKSQLTPKEIEEWIEVEKKDTSNTLYFRQLIVSKKQKTEF